MLSTSSKLKKPPVPGFGIPIVHKQQWKDFSDSAILEPGPKMVYSAEQIGLTAEKIKANMIQTYVPTAPMRQPVVPTE